MNDAWQSNQKLRFLAVGMWNTAFAYVAFLTVYGLLHRHVHYLLISVLTHLFAVANAFVCQRSLVFRSRAPWWPAFLRFNVVQCFVLIGSVASITLLVELLHWPPLVSQLTVMTAFVIASYALNRSYSFKAGKW